ncbi:rod shape-determining protein MreD [Longimicrobium sp.]|uniref:rod shape-determining protein MreD n=1 Tax=Longimicrobium sp. TaxID=2029185 RepID=UPI002CD4F038|nr:rod shape-determining protein MreD [Longimicrobium sp.]HSU13479.1 rod shape-determining protein MreD [Longimicrobium sp.]
MTEGTRWKFAVFIVVLVALHFILRVGLGLGVLAPDLLVVALLLASRRLRPGTAAGLGFLLGLLEGSANPFVFGVASLALAILGYLGSRSREWLAGDDPLNMVAFFFAGTLLYELLLYVMLAVGGVGGSVMALLIPALLASVYAAAVGLGASTLYRSLA